MKVSTTRVTGRLVAARPSRTLTVLAIAGLLSAGCSSSGSPAKTQTPPSVATRGPSSQPVSSAPASTSPPPAATSPAAAGRLAGTWTGTYASKKFSSTQGSFEVVFTQRGSAISGTIKLDAACVVTGTVSGTLTGDTIDFGAVKGQGRAVNFTGSVAGNRMQGTYRSGASCGNDNGTWTASRS